MVLRSSLLAKNWILLRKIGEINNLFIPESDIMVSIGIYDMPLDISDEQHYLNNSRDAVMFVLSLFYWILSLRESYGLRGDFHRYRPKLK